MGEQIKRTGNELKERWMMKMPPFFRHLVTICVCIIIIAFTINTAVPALGGTLHAWWSDIYTYILAGCVGIIITCKLTVAGGYKEIDPDKVLHGNKKDDE